MAILAELVAYVRGPINYAPSFIAKAFGAKSKEVYFVNPQLYLGSGGSESVKNFGVEDHAFISGNVPSREQFSSDLERTLRDRLGDGIEITGGSPIVPAECIKIRVEFED